MGSGGYTTQGKIWSWCLVEKVANKPSQRPRRRNSSSWSSHEVMPSRVFVFLQSRWPRRFWQERLWGSVTQMKWWHQSLLLHPNVPRESNLIGHTIPMVISTWGQQDLPLFLALIVHCASSLGVAGRQSIPLGRDGPARSSEVLFAVGNQGCSVHEQWQELLDLDGNEHLHGYQS